ncbi:MAG: hypothetical protein AAF125_12605, partial [Chloroflexota bacterium]
MLIHLLYILGVFVFVGVALHALVWDHLTRNARGALLVMGATSTVFAVGYTLSLQSGSAGLRWFFALNGVTNPPGAFTALLIASLLLIALFGETKSRERERGRAPAPLLLVLASVPIHYLTTDATFPTTSAATLIPVWAALAGCIAALLAAEERKAGSARWYGGLLALNGVASSVIIAWVMIAPTVGAWLAESVSVDYGAVELVGYQVETDVISASTPRQIEGTLYWRLHGAAEVPYTGSIGVLPLTENENIARTDIELRRAPLPNTTAWLPGLAFATPFTLTDVPRPDSPAGYQLTV